MPKRFLTVLWLLGGVLLLVFVGDLLLRGTERFPQPPVWDVPGGHAARGRQLTLQYGCGGCHVIPGVSGAVGRVGPQLNDFRNQIYIAGMLPNTPTNLVVWLLNPQQINPGTAMPHLQVTEQDAHDIAAYLYTLR